MPAIEPEQTVERLLSRLAAEPVHLRPGFQTRLIATLTQAAASRKRAWLLPARGWAWAALTLALLLVLGVDWLATPRSAATATLEVREGQAVVQQTRPVFLTITRSGERTLTRGQTTELAPGDRVRTDASGEAIILYPSGSTTEIQPDTDLSLTELRKEDSGWIIRLKVWAGETIHRVQRTLDSIPFFETETPLITAGVRGTVFRLRAISEDHTYLATDEGLVRVQMGDQAVDVPAGYEVDAIAGQPLQVRPQATIQINLAGKPKAWEATLSAVSAFTLEGTAPPGTTMILLVNGQEVARGQADEEGRFALPITFPAEGTYSLELKAVGPDGLVPIAPPVPFTHDATPPSLEILEPTTSEVTGASVTLRGRTEPGALVRVGSRQTEADAQGLFSVEVPLNPGTNEITVTATDAAGNTVTSTFYLVRQ